MLMYNEYLYEFINMIIWNSSKMLRRLSPALEKSQWYRLSFPRRTMGCLESAPEDCSSFMADLKVSQITLLLIFWNIKGYFKKLKNMR